MKASESFITTLRESPKDAVIASHSLMIRAGLIKKIANGLYSYMPLGFRSYQKVEKIIREELNAKGILEIKPTVIQPAELWKESGRWQSFGEEMLRTKTRGGQEMLVSPTAEEAFTFLVRESLTSYKQLPIFIYQINTKYRDEIRPRYGVMRGREFVMMDAYSFDADEKSLDESYKKCSEAYHRIFLRMGLPTISVKADTGAMGGSGSEEFMVESEIGDNTLILCPKCGYAANVEKASCQDDSSNEKVDVSNIPEIEKVPCPGVETIAKMESFFKMEAKRFIKVLIYKAYNVAFDFSDANHNFKKSKDENGNSYYPEFFVAVAIRGDLDVNETKLTAFLKASSVELAESDDVIFYSGAPHGFVGPVGLDKLPLIADESIITKNDDGTFDVKVHDAVTGSGTKDFDSLHVEPLRDFVPFATCDLRITKEGDRCIDCGATLYSKKGNELGHIFKLGTKYTKSMNVTFLDENGKPQTPLMGCYGIGLDRTLASIIEAHHDEKGIIWPMSVAPYHVVIIPIKYDGKIKELSDTLYMELETKGIDVLLDDRNERPGVKFADMDLIGIPIRVVVGEKNLPNVEIKERRSSEGNLVPAKDAANTIEKIVQEEIAKLNQ